MIDIGKARTVAALLRAQGNVALAAQVELLIAQAQASRSDGVNIKVGIRFRLEKFDGDRVEGAVPVEVIEGTG